MNERFRRVICLGEAAVMSSHIMAVLKDRCVVRVMMHHPTEPTTVNQEFDSETEATNALEAFIKEWMLCEHLVFLSPEAAQAMRDEIK